jgi:hypothetical protein
MTVEIPSLRRPLIELVLCAKVPDPALAAKIGNLTAYYGVKPGRHAVQLIGNDDNGGHVHLEIGLAAVANAPTRNSTKQKISE